MTCSLHVLVAHDHGDEAALGTLTGLLHVLSLDPVALTALGACTFLLIAYSRRSINADTQRSFVPPAASFVPIPLRTAFADGIIHTKRY